MRASGRQWSAALVKFVQFVQFVVVFFCPLPYGAIPFGGIAQMLPPWPSNLVVVIDFHFEVGGFRVDADALS